ncbi:MAG TPA: triose-phosphate isomerase [Candidatus Polarisedimenticolaceae bacterium]
MTPSRRRPFVVGNSKMNLDEPRCAALTREVAAGTRDLAGVDVGIAPPFPFLRAALDARNGAPLQVGAQDVHWEDVGAFTGEVSAAMLASMSASFVILGHSERRHLLGETDEDVRRKVAAAFRHALVPIVCVGETEGERLAGGTLEVVERQMRLGLAAVPAAEADRLVVAYEPVWAIGTGRVATLEQIAEVHRLIRGRLAGMFGGEAAQRIRIQYGGSVTPQNAVEILALEEVDGALVGGASLDAARFLGIVRAALPAAPGAC